MIALPTIIFLGGAAIMTRLSGRAIATGQLESLPNKAALGRSFNPTWIVLAVAITVFADWTENLTQLGQIEGFARSGAAHAHDGRSGTVP